MKSLSSYSQIKLMTCCQIAMAIKNTQALHDMLPMVRHVDAPMRGKTLLVTAVELNNLPAVKVMLERGHADANQSNLSGKTAFDLATELGYSDIVNYLGEPVRVHSFGSGASTVTRPGMRP